MLKTTNENYSCQVISFDNLVVRDAKNSDNLVTVSIMWYNVLLNKNTNREWLFLFFPAECKLNTDYLANNNLYSDSELNADKEAKGYINSQGRVRAVRLRGNNSSALIMPISSLEGIVDYSKLKLWDKFNEINWVLLCDKYTPPAKKEKWVVISKTEIKPVRVEEKLLPKHFSTSQFMRNIDNYSFDDYLVITQKLHWTSLRVWNIKTKKKQTLMDKILRRQKYEYNTIYWTRNVIKNDRFVTDNFYGTDIYTLASKTFDNVLPKDVVVYAEIIWWAGPGTEIQKWYTYEYPQGAYWVYIYRITSVNEDWYQTEWSWDRVEKFCEEHWLRTVPVLEKCLYKDLNLTKYEDKNFFYGLWLTQAVPLPKEVVDEGICIRCEAKDDLITKFKFPKFLEYETKVLDTATEVVE